MPDSPKPPSEVAECDVWLDPSFQVAKREQGENCGKPIYSGGGAKGNLCISLTVNHFIAVHSLDRKFTTLSLMNFHFFPLICY